MQIRILIGILLSLVAVPGVGSPPATLACLGWLAGAVALTVLAGGAIRTSLALLVRRGGDAQRLFRWRRRLAGLYGFLALGLYAAVLEFGHWPQMVWHFLEPWAGSDRWLPQRLLILAPLLLLIGMTWCVGLSISRLVQRSLDGSDVPTTEAHPSLGRYLLFQTRLQLLIFLVPYVFVLGVHNIVMLAAGGRIDQANEDLIIMPALLAVYVLSPLMLRLVWSTQRLADGPLRQRLEGAARRAGVHVSDIIIWRTDGLMVNACVSGLGRLLRYVFLTDTLIDNLQPVQIEAVFCHELGHARFRHIPFFFLIAVGGGMALLLLSPLMMALGLSEDHALAVDTALLVVYWAGFFGFLSRRFERQSDLFAARLVDCPGIRQANACAMHQPGDEPSDDLVCPNRAWAFSSALERIAILNGTAVSSGSWRHFGIGRRMEFIADVVGCPDAVRRYDRRLRIFKSLFLAATIALGILVWLLTSAGTIQL